jgi:nucleotide-binding universal stress UspA family protein
MVMRILIATDFSPRSDRALRRGSLLARQNSAKLILTHVVDDDRPQRLINVERLEAAALLQDLAQTIRESDGIDCESLVVLGDAFLGIVRGAEEIGADLLVLGPHRRQVLRDVFLGTTAERTVRTSRVPVLMANGVPAGSYRTVLIATDFSDASSTAAQAAKRLGIFATADIIALHVLDYVKGGPVIRAAMTIKEVEDQAAKLRARAMDDLDAFANKLGVPADRRAIGPSEESTSMAINKYAKATKADVIVVGTHCRSSFEKLLLGCVAESVLGDADTDVLAVPPP